MFRPSGPDHMLIRTVKFCLFSLSLLQESESQCKTKTKRIRKLLVRWCDTCYHIFVQVSLEQNWTELFWPLVVIFPLMAPHVGWCNINQWGNREPSGLPTSPQSLGWQFWVYPLLRIANHPYDWHADRQRQRSRQSRLRKSQLRKSQYRKLQLRNFSLESLECWYGYTWWNGKEKLLGRFIAICSIFLIGMVLGVPMWILMSKGFAICVGREQCPAGL